jgi:hypothetical protein
MASINTGGSTAGLANVDSNYNLNVALSNIPASVGAVRMMSENDAGVITGVPYLKSPDTSVDSRLKTGIDSLLFSDAFNGTAQNTSLWKYVFATLTSTMGSGSILLNSTSTLTTSTGCQLSTVRSFRVSSSATIYFETTLAITAQPLANQVIEFGSFQHNTGIVAPLDGVFFRFSSAGLFGISTFNGVENSTAALRTAVQISAGVVYKFSFYVSEATIEFWFDGNYLGSLNRAAGNGQPFMSIALPYSIQFRNSGTVSGAPVMQAKLTSVNVLTNDLAFNRPYASQMAGMGLIGAQAQNGSTMGQTAQWANATLPTAAAGTNTTAALGTGLGGIFQLNAPATGTTDLIISSYQNPVGTVNITQRNLIIRGIVVHCANLGAAVAVTGTTLAIAIAFGHTAVSLATAESASFATATTKAPRRLPVGIISLPVGTAIGATSVPISFDFEAPIIVAPGEFIALLAKPLIGTATVSQVLAFVVGFNSHFD